MSLTTNLFLFLSQLNSHTLSHAMGQVITIDELKSKMKRLWKKAAPVDREWRYQKAAF